VAQLENKFDGEIDTLLNNYIHKRLHADSKKTRFRGCWGVIIIPLVSPLDNTIKKPYA